LFVNHGLEVNVERDLDPASISMNTDGTIELTCSTNVRRPSTMVPRLDGVGMVLAAGAARSVNLYQSTVRPVVRIVTIAWAKELTRT
jgi:hypothetical protein